MNTIVENTIAFFFEKGAGGVFSKIGDVKQRKELRKAVEEFSLKFYEDRFYQIPMEQNFDFGGLNDFLLDNLHTSVAACFNAPEHKQRQFFNERLFRLAYGHSAADTKPKQNTVRVYVESILEIIKNYCMETLDGNDLFLANHSVDSAVSAVRGMMDTHAEDIKVFISYHGSFAECIDSVRHDLDTKKEYHYLKKSIRFQGRGEALEYLDGFLASEEPLLFTVVAGHGGAGKSKLMFHYMQRETGNLDWKVVFPARGYLKRILNQPEWRYPKNLLVIIDYAGEMAKEIGEWIDSLSHSGMRPRKTRVVLLERQGVGADKDGGVLETQSRPQWYQKIAEYGGHNFEDLFYLGRSYDLEQLEHGHLFALMDNVAEIRGGQLKEDERQDIISRAETMGRADNSSRFTTPLMIILLTDAFLDGADSLRLNPNGLMEYIIKKNKTYWRETVCAGDRELYKSLEKLIVYATAAGGWDLAPLPGDSSAFLDKYEMTELRTVLSGVAESENAEMLMPLEPDIVGEYFVLWYLSEMAHKTYYFDFVRLLWSSSVKFAFFLVRCIDSYLCNGSFDMLMFDRYSLFGDYDEPLWSSRLLVYISYQMPKEEVKKIVTVVGMLKNIAEDSRYAENQEIVLEYAKGLFNLSCDQDPAASAETVARLSELARDSRYAGNQEIVLEYAKGLFNLSCDQDPAASAETIARLSELARDSRYAGNQEIVLRYAKGLFNLSCDQDPAASAETVARLSELARDSRYAGNQEIVLEYAKGLLNLSCDQDPAASAETIARLSELARDSRYAGNQEIVLTYAKGLLSITIAQDEESIDSAATRDNLKKLLQDSRNTEARERLFSFVESINDGETSKKLYSIIKGRKFQK